MNGFSKFSSFFAGIGLTLASVQLAAAPTRPAEELFKNFCSSCHGADMSGGLGPALNDDQWKHGSSDADIARVIREGVPGAAMPPWGKSLSDADVRALVILIRERSNSGATPALQPASHAIYTGAGHSFSVEKVASAPSELWSVEFLDEQTLLATQKDGQLWLFKNGERQAVQGLPAVWNNSQGGLLEVQRHPDSKTGWIYLTFAHPAHKGAMTKVVRGKLTGAKWTDEQTVYEAPAEFYTDAGVHFGSRLAFRDGYVFFSVGDRGEQDRAQDLAYPNGKIHRLHDDGRVPKDNPFVANPKALPTIWSYGHRNPQGLAVNPLTGDLWAAEHGPRGGDEVNLIAKGANYGWPVITYGMNYNGTPITEQTRQDGMEQPLHYWVPSIAVSGISFYTGKHFSDWHNHLLVGSLAKQQLRLLRVEQNRVVADELLVQGLGRIRDVAVGPDGYPYLVMNNGDGGIYRLTPANVASSKGSTP